jgi:signal transduction histidine kinase
MTRRQDGSGLGLPISKELTEQMGGTLEINSDAGLGTTVWITIPCQATEVKRKKIL